MIQVDEHIFQRGWNHQLDEIQYILWHSMKSWLLNGEPYIGLTCDSPLKQEGSKLGGSSQDSYLVNDHG